MLRKSTTLLILILFLVVYTLESRDDRRIVKDKVNDGSEVSEITSSKAPEFKLDRFEPIVGNNATYSFHPTGVFTVYDLQSNAVPQEIWQDPINPLNVHAAFMYSTVPGFATRDIAYIYSNDFGATWDYLGNVPQDGRSGFPAIHGFNNGSAVIATHTTGGGIATARTKLYYDAGPGFGVFTEVDPGLAPAMGDAIWPKIIAKDNNKIVVTASINATAGPVYTNSINIGPPPVLNGWIEYAADNAEAYALALAPNGRIGNAYVGKELVADNDVFYRFSTDDGVSWSTPLKIWDWNPSTDSLGTLRGVSLAFGNNNEPYVAFNTSLLTEAGFFPESPSQIRVWSPGINGGVAKVVADSSMIPFFPNRGAVTDAFLPICRPSIGRSNTQNALFVSMVATTGIYGSDTSSYYAGWFAYSVDNGNSWVRPERMTPTTPLRDWRFISVSPTNNVTGTTAMVQMMAQDDSLAGTHVNGSPIGRGQAMGIRATVILVGINNISSEVPNQFNLKQNYPNPFNPTTSIRFDVSKTTNITLKVYNTAGMEVATLINNEVVSPGVKEVTFEGNNLSSGIYFYTMLAGNYKETKKMMLIK